MPTIELRARDSWVVPKRPGECDGERVECLFSSLGSGAEVTCSLVADVANGEVKDLEDGVVSGEVPQRVPARVSCGLCADSSDLSTAVRRHAF